jgi:hypothetical protein
MTTNYLWPGTKNPPKRVLGAEIMVGAAGYIVNIDIIINVLNVNKEQSVASD